MIADTARALAPSLRKLMLTANSAGFLHGNRGGAGYRALAKRGLTWARANYLLTPDGISVLEVLRGMKAEASQ